MDTVMDVGQEDMKCYWERMEVYQEKLLAKIKTDQEEMKIAINSIQSELEKTIKNWVDAVKTRTYVDSSTTLKCHF